MLYSTKTAEQKRIDLRQTLKQGGAQQFPGAFTPLTAKPVSYTHLTLPTILRV